MSNIYLRNYLSVVLLLLLFNDNCAYAEDKQVIKLGMSTALTGPAKQIGEQLYQGSNVYFNKVNKSGGINGVQVQLIVADDGYEPRRAVRNTRHFIYKDKVDALFGAMGTPTSFAVSALLEKLQTPYLMPYSGAEFLHYQPKMNVFNLRASYEDEADEQIKYLVEEKNHSRIGLLIQADEFGFVVESGLRKSLAKFNLKPVKVARFQRNSHDIANALKTLKASGVTAISLVGTYKPLSEFINNAYEQQFTPEYTSVSFASNSDLLALLKYPSEVMVTEVVPNPHKCSAYWCREFLKDMALANINKPNRIHFEGYLNAMVFTTAAQRCPQPLQHNCLMQRLNIIFSDDKQINALFINKTDKNKHIVYRSVL
ncbi:ABC transporter substrate-binding protein [Pseudoalteromonas prydzensis]|uniref:ABC transporter substrate-binding protein n=1 Tax=Pseudoalteromonas prydzensis TaxID=182141 RepID=UPI0024BC28AF|nr:ABC transporter substrate-binding protein [Pseudoalteromonas prydzensis]